MSPDEVKEDLDALKAEVHVAGRGKGREIHGRRDERSWHQIASTSLRANAQHETSRGAPCGGAFFVNTWRTRSIDRKSILIKILIARKVLMEQ